MKDTSINLIVFKINANINGKLTAEFEYNTSFIKMRKN